MFEKFKEKEYLIGLLIILGTFVFSFVLYSSINKIQNTISSIDPSVFYQKENENKDFSDQQKVNIYVISDKRCASCNSYIQAALSELSSIFSVNKTTIYYYQEKEGKELFNKVGGQFLPLFLFDKSLENQTNYPDYKQYFGVSNNFFFFTSPIFDPNMEICNNGVDDNENGKIDCADSYCSKSVYCMEKVERPKLELFVMSYCPYGLQMQKGLLPVLQKLNDKLDWDVRFVYYIMHGEKELKENMLQHCIQEYNKTKYLDYLSCFLNGTESQICLQKANISNLSLIDCLNKTDAIFNVTKNFNDTSTYLQGRYPIFLVDEEFNKKYNVQGSPTFVLNGVELDINRDPQTILKTVCSLYKSPPAECNSTLPDKPYVINFGFNFQ